MKHRAVHCVGREVGGWHPERGATVPSFITPFISCVKMPPLSHRTCNVGIEECVLFSASSSDLRGTMRADQWSWQRVRSGIKSCCAVHTKGCTSPMEHTLSRDDANLTRKSSPVCGPATRAYPDKESVGRAPSQHCVCSQNREGIVR